MADVAKPPSSSASDSRRHEASSSASASAKTASSSSESRSRDPSKVSGSATSSSDPAKQRPRGPPGKDATAEEKAQWEIERKKIQKYKEDKLKARRDHTRLILESHAQAKRRALLGKQSEFLANLEFRNVLPDLPFDTKFLQYPHEPDRLVKYKPNTLETDYTYEVHEDTNLGLDIDLIDPAKYEAPEHAGPLEVGDEQVLMMKEANSRTVKTKVRPMVTWLRRTEYMGTDLSESTHKFKSEIEIQSALREGTENALAEVVNVTLEDRAEASFRDANSTKTFIHPSNKKLKAVKVWDVLPDQILAANKYAILSYDLMPSHDLRGKNIASVENRALLCGVSNKHPDGLMRGSILLPHARDEEEHKESEELPSEKYGYFREYQLAIDSLETRDSQHVMFILDPESNQFTYTDLHNRLQLRKTKLGSEDKRRRGAIVHRRSYSEAELERRNAIRFDYGGLFDDVLNNEDHIRDYKRQRKLAKNADEEEALEQHTNGATSPAISDSDSD